MYVMGNKIIIKGVIRMENYRKELVIMVLLYLTDFVYLSNVLGIAIIVNMILDIVVKGK